MNTNSIFGTIGSLFIAIVGFILIIYLAYFATKKMGRRLSIRGVGSKNIKILENISIGQNKSIAIIETAGKVLLIGITQNDITLICELDENMIDRNEDEKSSSGMEFSKAFKSALEQKFGRKFNKSKENKNDSSEE